MTSTRYRSIFDIFDKDGSGCISRSELKEAVGACGQTLGDQVFHEAIEKSGLNDEEISFEVFSNFMQELESKTITFEDVEQLFQSLDIDSSGYLTAAEVRHFMTNIGLCGEDAIVDEMISQYDLDGNGQITVEELLFCLKEIGYRIENGEDRIQRKLSPQKSTVTSTSERVEKEVVKCEPINIDTFPKEIQKVMSLFDFNSEHHVCKEDLERAAELLKLEKLKGVRDPEANPALHWTAGRKKSGLGDLFYKANHIAIIVKDVGRSASFYTNVMGFQQIRRPRFDRHGAWFAMGNLELHHIKGTPIVHSGDDFIVGHISTETFDIKKVPTVFRKVCVPFKQHVSVPRGADAEGTKKRNTSDKIVRQYFIRDPDGYYIEICNCDILTSYCLGEETELSNNEEGEKPLTVENATRVIASMHKWTGLGQQNQNRRESLIQEVKATDGSIEAYAKLLGYSAADEVDEDKLHNLIARRSVYGDICQNENEDDLKRVLMSCGNDVPKANTLMTLRADVKGSR